MIDRLVALLGPAPHVLDAFDAAMYWYSTIHSPDDALPRIAAEAARVVRPGGPAWTLGQGSLEDHDRRLVGAGDLRGLRDIGHLGAGEQDDRRARTGTDQVTDRVGLAGAGRTVEEDAALEVLSAPAELVAVGGELDDVAADLGEGARREDDPVVCGQVGGAGRT